MKSSKRGGAGTKRGKRDRKRKGCSCLPARTRTQFFLSLTLPHMHIVPQLIFRVPEWRETLLHRALKFVLSDIFLFSLYSSLSRWNMGGVDPSYPTKCCLTKSRRPIKRYWHNRLHQCSTFFTTLRLERNGQEIRHVCSDLSRLILSIKRS